MVRKYCGCFDTYGGAVAFSILLSLGILGAVLTAILVPVASLQAVNQDEIAITYNDYTKVVSSDIYDQGRYILPLTTVVRYKRTAQNIDMVSGGNGVLHCLTREGLEMQLDITAQYQIVIDDVFDIFHSHGLENRFRYFLVTLTRNTIKDVCPFFTGVDFFNNRGVIENHILENLKNAFSNSTAHATIELVQLRNVKHPESYEEANRRKEETEQEKDRALSARSQAVTDAETRLVSSRFDARNLLIASQATADSNIIAANERAKVEVTKWSELQKQLVNVYSQFQGVSIEDFIKEYVRYQVISARNETIIGFK